MTPLGHEPKADRHDERPSSPFSRHVLTLFPDFFSSPLATSIVRRAIDAGHLDVGVHDIREFTHDRHRTTDDTPYGGGAGMVMKPEPIVEAIEHVEAAHGRLYRILLTPQGRPFTQVDARRLSEMDGIVLLCGRYEGVDERVREGFIDEELTIGDYVLTGGEPAALVVLDAVIRLREGVLGNAESSVDESFSDPSLLEYPHYTRPYDFRGECVPEILRSGDHGRIARWRREQALLRTYRRRPELFARLVGTLSEAERSALISIEPALGTVFAGEDDKNISL